MSNDELDYTADSRTISVADDAGILRVHEAQISLAGVPESGSMIGYGLTKDAAILNALQNGAIVGAIFKAMTIAEQQSLAQLQALYEATTLTAPEGTDDGGSEAK